MPGREQYTGQAGHGEIMHSGMRPAERIVHQHETRPRVAPCESKRAGFAGAEIHVLRVVGIGGHDNPSITHCGFKLPRTRQSAAGKHFIANRRRHGDLEEQLPKQTGRSGGCESDQRARVRGDELFRHLP